MDCVGTQQGAYDGKKYYFQTLPNTACTEIFQLKLILFLLSHFEVKYLLTLLCDAVFLLLIAWCDWCHMLQIQQRHNCDKFLGKW